MMDKLITTTWERCKSLGRDGGGGGQSRLSRKNHSRHGAFPEEGSRPHGNRRRVAPEGCFAVFVGPQKQKFFVKTEYANHPLFRVLLEEAEAEYGYSSEGPIELPCDVEVFYTVLTEMDSDDDGVSGNRGKRSL
ncbi:hypothetical protein SAY86_018993 [Trapa natans]|uniref:Uncharacterized protein n=1 Tax=Trapa natans TaxID=22666 RepID=A0AAN7R1H1_TRANT|nr:hypothetical protein SAY86_018993 [Trapa natans]